jgi:predicted secreted acid phosphatase
MRQLLPAVAFLALAAPAHAETTRTAQTPEQIRAYNDSGQYLRDIAAVYAQATSSVRTQLRRRVRKPAVVLDIDETSLSNYPCFDAKDFDLSGLADCVRTSGSQAIGPARDFFRFARRRRVAVFFITGVPTLFLAARRTNLRQQGYVGTYEVIGRRDNDRRDTVVPYKSGARRRIQRRGFTILANVGDQESDLAGGYARRRFKLPNPIYVVD